MSPLTLVILRSFDNAILRSSRSRLGLQRRNRKLPATLSEQLWGSAYVDGASYRTQFQQVSKIEPKEEPPNHSGTIYIFFLLFAKVRLQKCVMTIRIDLSLLCFKSHRCTWKEWKQLEMSASVYSWLPSHHSRKVFIGAILMPRGLSGLTTPAEWDIIDFNEV